MNHNGSNMTISSAVVEWAKLRTRVIEDASSNLARSVLFRCTDKTKNSRKA